MFKFVVFVVLAAIELSAAASDENPKFVGRFEHDYDPDNYNYERLFKTVGYKNKQIRELMTILPGLRLEVYFNDGKLTSKFYTRGREISNTFKLGVKKNAKLLIGGTAPTTVFQHSYEMLALYVLLPKAELSILMDCSTHSCMITYTARNVNLATTWKRI